MSRPAPLSPPTPKPADKLTIQDVATYAGVSKATVSRYLNRGGEQLSADVEARVAKAVRELGYSPSPMAQALKRGKSRLIGLVVADVSNSFSVAVLRGVEKACRDAGYMVMLFNLANDEQLEREAIRALSAYRVEGFILHTLGHDAGALADAAQLGKPVVLVDRKVGDAEVDLIALDNRSAVQSAAGHLSEAGYRHLLFISEPLKAISSRNERASAFQGFIAEHADSLSGAVFEARAGDDAALDEALRALRRRAGDAPAAVLAANAVISLRIAAATARLGWQLGTDLGLIGFDDPEWAALVGPGITAISQPTDDIGRVATHCLIERLQGAQLPPRQVLLPGTLVRRGSTRRA
ncbi:LacI family DNA-binding transcriptional regulator [Cupriavidus basilensis]|uniref:LacI family DNA-binding transcriptional regulator n=1 Tax=Cupriavidus basilensis TaxID=68895 RepID=A0ABT6AKX7_9BURK|nr:LacI family DNA-binding transcriptional regulator [Cupriavidus basilensis]MDF3833068.1 LacI family DNA-binding transcriptional regulator [Cupriavidus basilensis]